MAMKLLLSAVLFLAFTQGVPSQGEPPQRELAVWRDFVQVLRSGPFPAERIRPYRDELGDAMVRFLSTMREQARWSEWNQDPEVFRVGPQLHFLLPLTFDSGKTTYTFSFLLDGDRWYFQHLEAIQLRLDRIGPLPASVFPDVEESTKAWIRAETDVARDVALYKALAAEKGADTARKWLLDGAGYALAARAWVPFVAPPRAFILYACWEQANLRGNRVVLEALADEAATIRMTPLWFELYEKAAHLRQQIARQEYQGLFESIWRDRAANAGWTVAFSYAGRNEVTLHFRRPL